MEPAIKSFVLCFISLFTLQAEILATDDGGAAYEAGSSEGGISDHSDVQEQLFWNASGSGISSGDIPAEGDSSSIKVVPTEIVHPKTCALQSVIGSGTTPTVESLLVRNSSFASGLGHGEEYREEYANGSATGFESGSAVQPPAESGSGDFHVLSVNSSNRDIYPYGSGSTNIINATHLGYTNITNATNLGNGSAVQMFLHTLLPHPKFCKVRYQSKVNESDISSGIDPGEQGVESNGSGDQDGSGMFGFDAVNPGGGSGYVSGSGMVVDDKPAEAISSGVESGSGMPVITHMATQEGGSGTPLDDTITESSGSGVLGSGKLPEATEILESGSALAEVTQGGSASGSGK